VIGFSLDGELGIEDVRASVSAPVQVAGNQVEVETERPQADLYRLLSLAERRGATIEDLEVRRPSLEDIFLELTRKEES
jgi:ABC-type multidrug transport system ATPase subunit